MPVRSSMAAIITETRLLINDPAGGSQLFTDQQVQDHLDETRFDVRYEQLTAVPSIVNTTNSSTGTADFIWADYFSLYHWWETDCVIQDGHFIVLTPAGSDYLVGHWQFELTPFVNGTVPGQYPPLFITGKAYDINYAAKTLWTLRAATLATAYDFTADGQSFKRSQQLAMCLKMADYYGCRAMPRSIAMRRDDLTTVSHAEQVPILGSNRDIVEGW